MDDSSRALLDAVLQAKADIARLAVQGGRKGYRIIPGAGKSTVISQLVEELNVGYFVAFHALYDENGTLKGSRAVHFKGATEHNCPDWKRCNNLAALGINPAAIHKKHGCDYYKGIQELSDAVSVVYAHKAYPSGNVKDHDIDIIDEQSILAWVDEGEWTSDDLDRAYQGESGNAQWLLKAYIDVVRRLKDDKSDAVLQGKVLWDELATKFGGHMLMSPARMLESVVSDIEPRRAEASLDDSPESVTPQVAPRLAAQMSKEMDRWQGCLKGERDDWNSAIRVSREGVVIVKRMWRNGRTAANATAVLDATIDADLAARFWSGEPFEVVDLPAGLAPGTRHIAVRIPTQYGGIKRYGKRQMVNKDGSYLNRAVREAEWVLDNRVPGWRGMKVGLVTHMAVEDAVSKALGIPSNLTGHFGNIRGFNHLEQCELLVVLGTPRPNAEALYRAARLLYDQDDDDPIVEGEVNFKFLDPRVAEIARAVEVAELTQAAHRNRPARHAGRIIVTLCDGDIGYLEDVTEVVTEINLSGKVSVEDRLLEAAERIAARGEKVTGERLRIEAHCDKNVARRWLKLRKEPARPMAAD